MPGGDGSNPGVARIPNSYRGEQGTVPMKSLGLNKSNFIGKIKILDLATGKSNVANKKAKT